MANGGIVKPRGITLRDETPALADPRLVLWAINIPASNGVIHTIDRVLGSRVLTRGTQWGSPRRYPQGARGGPALFRGAGPWLRRSPEPAPATRAGRA